MSVPVPFPADVPENPEPRASALVVGVTRLVWLTPDGEVESPSPALIARRIAGGERPLVVHGRALARRLELPGLAALDLLELFAFVRPAQSCLPTARGLARALGLPAPAQLEDEALLLAPAAGLLLAELRRTAPPLAAALAPGMAEGGWPWGPYVRAALDGVRAAGAGWRVWEMLPEISDHAPPPPPGNHPVEPAAARQRLAQMLGAQSEARPSQSDYAAAVSAAFAPRQAVDQPQMVLAEAGTGVGKTLGYLAPASLWAERNEGAVWVSTYTRNLQHQIEAELSRLWRDPAERTLNVVVRKGRENYLCLLNLEDAVRARASRPADGAWLGLVVRWAAATRDGDFSGADFPGWLPDLVGRGRALGLADRRGECIYAACPHFDRCFIERGIRRARRARIVIANHALVMIQAAMAGDDDGIPTRLVFDEGHHLFDAADSAFAAHLSGGEGEALRRWLLGAEGGRSRARGLKRRVEDLIAADETAQALTDRALQAARHLPGDGWLTRLAEDRPMGPLESFLERVRAQIAARAPSGGEGFYARETERDPPIEGMADAAARAKAALSALAEPLVRLRDRLLQRLEDEAEELDTQTRQRLTAIGRSLDRRALNPLRGWMAMLDDLARPTPADFVDWLQVEFAERREIDVGLYRHWVDPTQPFAAAVARPAHGVLVTSATLTDGGDPDTAWHAAEARAGVPYLDLVPGRASVASPFDYAAQTRVLIVTDVRKDDLGQVASAYRALIQASGGGALGLFTAISRLRAVHGRIAPALERSGLPLLAQHVDPLETAALIDIFRAEEDASLLGTDAVRDGVDVPGRSLRLIVFDRVPWPRPDILHRARRARFGGRAHDDRVTRLRLRQAFGRLIRRAGDSGVFVLLDPMMPTRLTDAFPAGTPVERVGLAEAVAITRDFLTPPANGLDPAALIGEGPARLPAPHLPNRRD